MIRFALVVLLGLLFGGCAGLGGASPTPPDVAPRVECVGTPLTTCQTVVDDARQNAEPGTLPIQIRAVCGSPSCTAQGGEVDVEVRYSNGRTDRYTMSWEGAAPGGVDLPPALPVEPTCEGVSVDACRDMAISAMTGVTGGRAVVGILVRCVGACTELRGAGEAILTYADGTTTSASWDYVNSAP
jgi:hypothetical protein